MEEVIGSIPEPQIAQCSETRYFLGFAYHLYFAPSRSAFNGSILAALRPGRQQASIAAADSSSGACKQLWVIRTDLERSATSLVTDECVLVIPTAPINPKTVPTAISASPFGGTSRSTCPLGAPSTMGVFD